MSTSGDGIDPDATLPGIAGAGDGPPVSATGATVAAGSSSTDRDGPPPGDTNGGTVPDTIGKYRILHRLGEGGMGVVYAAEDPELKRKVAIKLVRPALEGSRGGDAGKARLLREAQALARLSSHPNIVNVYEVGTLGNRVFIVMEFIEGIPLLRWQFVRTGGWREVLRAYRAAGRALAAAHAGGVVHRDFKAENVLVREDGDVRVLDFGLASEATDGAAATGGAARLQVDPVALDTAVGRLTQTGALLGTPAYMSPEQLAGEKIDERSDQFSFCVSLYEALYGERPHAGETLGQLILSVTRGEVREPPRFVKVPPWVRKVLLRGLAVNPDDRWPGMKALLSALERDPRRMLGVGAALVGAVALSGAVWAANEHQSAQDLARTRAEATRVEFLEARSAAGEAVRRASFGADASAAWNRFVLSRAAAFLLDDPSRSLAALLHLRAPDGPLMITARLLADAALRTPIVRVEVPLPARPVQLGWLRDHVAVAMEGGALRLISARDGTWHDLSVGGSVEALATTRAGSTLVVGGPWGVRGIDSSGKVLFDDARPATALAADPVGERLLVARPGGTIEVGQPGMVAERVLGGHRGDVTRLALAADGVHLASVARDGLRLWNLDKDTHRELDGVEDLQSLGFGAGVLRAVDGTGQGHLWELDKPVGRRGDLAVGVRAFDLADDGRHFVGVAENGTVVWGQAGSGSPEVLTRNVRLASLSADAGTAAVATDDVLTLWSLRAGAPRRIAAGDQVNRLGLDPDGTVVAGLRSGAMVRLPEAASTATELARVPGPVATWAFAADSARVAVTDSEGTLGVIDLPDGKVRSLRGHSEFPSQPLSWSASGDVVAASTCETGQRCFTALYPVNGDTPTRMPGQHPPLSALELSEDGRWLAAAAAYPCDVWAWDLHEARRVISTASETPADADCLGWQAGVDRVRVIRASRPREGEEGRARQMIAHELELETGTMRALLSLEAVVLAVGTRSGGAVLYAEDLAAPVLWDLHRAAFHPLPALPATVQGIALSHDGAVAHLSGAGSVRSLVLATGLGVERSRPARHHVWTGEGALVEFRGGDLLVHERHTPAEPEALATWLSGQTSRRLTLDELIGH